MSFVNIMFDINTLLPAMRCSACRLFFTVYPVSLIGLFLFKVIYSIRPLIYLMYMLLPSSLLVKTNGNSI